MDEKKIRAIIIVEVMGKPVDYLKEALEKHISGIDKTKYAKIIKKNIAEPKEIEESAEKGLFSTFAELEVELNNFEGVLNLIFDFMPSSIEILEPEVMTLSLQEATMIINDLAGRLHQYDNIAKIADMKIKQLEHYIKENSIKKPISVEKK